MRKIPTIFVRDWENDPSRVTREPNPDCAWVFAGEGRATRKLDGTATRLDEDGRWWGRREVKPGKTPPPNFQLVQVDDRTGKRTGWQPIEDTPYAKVHVEALNFALEHGPQFELGTYELCGPKINRDPEQFGVHFLIRHGTHELDDVPLDFDGLAAWLLAHPYEGIVWHHPDGRLAKLKRRDIPAELAPHRDTEAG
ncbi:hypothetical protein E1287_07285 [Actinomadura sp. KC06]|uniref:RNA ligase 1 family protein n=1 Tax=Actinomadura sp. KC06 TaxID=2530369 RepID=UPI0010493136|nr:DUF5565 family protein [Actinomadura sp. KC06]TDD37852.1 hypothetical protein E1287_07285 [Actinomadura sp. KC06]